MLVRLLSPNSFTAKIRSSTAKVAREPTQRKCERSHPSGPVQSGPGFIGRASSLLETFCMYVR